MPKSEQELAEESTHALLYPEHLVKFAESNLNTDSRQKAHQHGTRQEIGEKTQAKDSGQEKYAGSHKSNQARECDILRRVGGEGKGSQARRDHGCGRRVSTDDEVSRGAEQGVYQNW